MKLTCASCGAAIAGADIDLPGGVGRCAICGAKTPLPDPRVSAAEDLEAAALVVPEPGEIGFRPDTLPWREQPIDGGAGGSRFELSPGLPQRLIAAVLLGFLLLFLFANRGDAIFAIFRAVVGIALAWPMYKVLQSGLNRTALTLDAGGLRLQRRPLPERRALDVPLVEIVSFAVGPASILPSMDAAKTAWGVRLLTADRRLVELPLRSMNREEAAWMAARLNLALSEARRAAGLAADQAGTVISGALAPAADAARHAKGRATTG